MLSQHRVVVVIPTYNERLNLENQVVRLSSLPGLEILIVDDSSPDGTGHLADTLASSSSRISVLHRMKKEGLALAYFSGFEWASKRDFDYVIQMDADGSHRVKDIPRLLAALGGGDVEVVIGSRWIKGGRTVDWPFFRKVLSIGANLLITLLLKLGVRDSTSGFRIYSACFIRYALIQGVRSQGFAFQVEMTQLARRGNFRLVEVPICFEARESGDSKMSLGIITESIRTLTVLAASRRKH